MEETRVLTADVILNVEQKRSSFESEAAGLTPLEANAAGQKGRYDEHRDQIVRGFNFLDTMPSQPSPKFVFAHIMAPHPPFVLGPNGEAIYPKGPLNLSDGSMLHAERLPAHPRPTPGRHGRARPGAARRIAGRPRWTGGPAGRCRVNP